MNTKNFKHILTVLFVSLLAFTSCKEDEKFETPRLFRPLTIELVSGTKVGEEFIVKFPKTRDAASYQLKISSTADFSSDVEEIEIPVTDNEAEVKYTISHGSIMWTRADIYDFYITVKAKSVNGAEYDSKFCTPVLISPYRENLFTKRKKEFLFNSPSETDTIKKEQSLKDQVTLTWDGTDFASRLVVKDQSGATVKDITFAGSEPLDKTVTVTGLSPLTNYTAFIYEGTLSRGRVRFATTSPNEKVISVGTHGSDLSAIIAAASDGDVLRLKNDADYNTAGAAIAINKNITIESFQEENAVISNSKGFTLDGTLSYFNLKGLTIVGQSTTTDPCITSSATFVSVNDINIDKCVINTFKNLVNYSTSGGVDGTQFGITINNSFISNMMGTAHTIDLRNNLLNHLYITNSTFYNLSRGIVRAGSDYGDGAGETVLTNQKVVVSNNTFYKIQSTPNSHIFYLGKATAAHTGSYNFTFNIFSNTDASAGGFQLAGSTVSMYNNYYSFKLRTAEQKPLDLWTGGTRQWGSDSNNKGLPDGTTNGFNPKFVDVLAGDFTPQTTALNNMAPNSKPVGAPYWVK